jgi:N-acetylglucosaminyldiphosphoundecaprenol N-acetyl-beta-D-mannosaminyltransferase
MAAVRFVEEHPAHFIFLAVGSPRQERLAKCLQERGVATGVGLCIGASLLFLTGSEKRAPKPLRQAGLEWVWRLGINPRRMWRRYLVDDIVVLRLVWREAVARCREAALRKLGRNAS